jgi:adenosylhomocysteine nucleosidase
LIILAVTGLAREARLVAGPGVTTITGGGHGAALARQLAALPAKQVSRILSIGICGALAPELQVGDAVVASDVRMSGEQFACDAAWTRAIAARLPAARVVPFAGSDVIAPDPQAKAALRAQTGAAVVDMESHLAAREAHARGLPFAAVRVVSDSANRALPPAARLALRSDGRPDPHAVFHSLIAMPTQLPSLIRTAWEAEKAFASLLRCCRALGRGFGVPDLGELSFDMR